MFCRQVDIPLPLTEGVNVDAQIRGQLLLCQAGICPVRFDGRPERCGCGTIAEINVLELVQAVHPSDKEFNG